MHKAPHDNQELLFISDTVTYIQQNKWITHFSHDFQGLKTKACKGFKPVLDIHTNPLAKWTYNTLPKLLEEQ